jgi:hypothetical protein
MKIVASTVELQSNHALVASRTLNLSSRTWGNVPTHAANPAATSVQISAAGSAQAASDAAPEGSSMDGLPARLWLAKALIEKLTGHRFHVFDAGSLSAGDGRTTANAAPAPSAATGWGVEFTAHSVSQESEQTGFSAQGVVRTADGQEIRFQIDLSMSRTARTEASVRLRLDAMPAAGLAPANAPSRQDPLLLNFGGGSAGLSDTRFSFDINSDGKAEQVAMLKPGSAYLAIDKNGNGRIDSGAELFGPASGSGFTELASLDADHNGWIDAGDPAFSQLRLWTPTADGGGTLQTLAQRQVGALYLGAVSTPFALRGQGNSDLGTVSATGLYLSESGQAGTMQDIDVTV